MKERTLIRRTLITADNILTGEDLTPRKGCGVLVEDGRIAAILTRDECESVKATAEVIDLGPRTLLPGLFECHNHLALDAGLPGHLEMMTLSECEHTVLALDGLKKDLMAGVTTARCMGDRNYLDVKIKKLIAEGKVEGPDLLVCGIGMRAVHGHGVVSLPHSGEEEFRRTSRENIYRHVDHLKIFLTPGAPALSPEAFIPCYMTRGEVAAVVGEARSVNIPVTAHCIGGYGLDLCIEEGVDVIDHLYSVTSEQVKVLENDFAGWIDLTSGIVLDEEREPFLSPAQAAKMREAREYSRECLSRLYQSKVRFTIGTDAYHGHLWKEVVYAVEGGSSVKDALKAVTVNAAKMTGLDKVKGRIEPGLQADLIAVERDPLDDPSSLAAVSFVMKNGQVVRKD